MNQNACTILSEFAQILWLIFDLITTQSVEVIKNIFLPQFAMWYLLALFLWRLLLPDLLNIKHILLISCILYFVGMICTGIDNLFAMQRSIGFLCFFVLGYYSNEMIIQKVRKIPKCVQLVAIISIATITYFLFNTRLLSWDTLFYVLTHTSHITSFDNVFVGVGLYAIAFILAVCLSITVLVLVPENNTLVTEIGDNTLPLYIGHGFIVHIVVNILNYFRLTSELSIFIILLIFSIATVAILSGKSYKSFITRTLYRIDRLIFKNEI